MATISAPSPLSGNLRVSYDRKVDVLHIGVGAVCDVEGDGLPGGIELNYCVSDDRPCGVTVLGFQRNGWSNNIGGLADIAGDHLDVDARTLMIAIERITK